MTSHKPAAAEWNMIPRVVISKIASDLESLRFMMSRCSHSNRLPQHRKHPKKNRCFHHAKLRFSWVFFPSFRGPFFNAFQLLQDRRHTHTKVDETPTSWDVLKSINIHNSTLHILGSTTRKQLDLEPTVQIQKLKIWFGFKNHKFVFIRRWL